MLGNGFPTPVHPQPVAAYAAIIVTPPWNTSVYVLFDLTHISGTMFSAYVASAQSALDRESILVIAELDREGAASVYVHEHPGPLRPRELVQLQRGYCITIAHAGHEWFAVASIDDMLQSHLGWDEAAPLPCVPGQWIHVLTDTEPGRFPLHPGRRPYVRQDVTHRGAR